jgi:hypothetical protein
VEIAQPDYSLRDSGSISEVEKKEPPLTGGSVKGSKDSYFLRRKRIRKADAPITPRLIVLGSGIVLVKLNELMPGLPPFAAVGRNGGGLGLTPVFSVPKVDTP